jgi:hypothetical protein
MVTIPHIYVEDARIVARRAPNHGSLISRSKYFPAIIQSRETRAHASAPSIDPILSINERFSLLP